MLQEDMSPKDGGITASILACGSRKLLCVALSLFTQICGKGELVEDFKDALIA